MTETEGQRVTETPVFPYYLDEEMVMSFLATIDDGLSIVRKVSQTLEDTEQGHLEGEVRAGISWLPFNFGGHVGSGMNSGRVSGEHWEAERQYPLISLFNLLRKMLFEKGVAKSIDGNVADPVEIGDVIEFSGSLRRNPIFELNDVWKTYQRLKPTFEQISGENEKGSTKVRSDRRKNLSPVTEINPQEKALKSILDVGVEGATSSGLLDVRASIGHEVFKDVVLTLRMERDPAQAIAFSQGSRCRVIGKVTGITPEGGYIPLFRRSGLELFPIETIGQLFAPFNNLPTTAIDLDDVAVKGPVIQVLPLAVFV